MDLKYNINKIHGDIISEFESVSILEKSNINFNNHFYITINEGNKTLKIIVKKTEISNNKFSWVYYDNPLNENSNLVERVSTIDTFSHDIKDIFLKNRFNQDYINSIK